MNKLATVLDKCPSCGKDKYVQATRVGRLCKPCSNRAKARARIVPVLDWAMPCRGCGEPMKIKARREPKERRLCRSCCARVAQAAQAMFARGRARCTVLGCDSFIRGKGLCPKHYEAQRRKRKEEIDSQKRERLQNMHSTAYMAGIIDGEGSICVFPYYGVYHKNHSYLRYRPALSVSNTSSALMDWIVEHFGGSIATVKRNRDLVSPGKWKKCYHWQITHKLAAAVVRVILPFLVIKKRQAELFLTFMETSDRCGKKGTKPEVLHQRKGIADEISKLNERGNKSAMEPEGLREAYAQSGG